MYHLEAMGRASTIRGHWSTLERFLGLGLAAILAGCATGGLDADGADHAGPSVLRGSDNGLEIRWWVVDDRNRTLGSILSNYEERPVGDSEDLRANWAANGLRIVSVPSGDLDRLRSVLPLIGAVHKRWLGQVPSWTEAIRGPDQPGPLRVLLDNGLIKLPAGSMRLLVRGWTAPMLTDEAGLGPVLHLELVPQHKETGRQLDRFTSGANLSERLQIEDEGQLFSRLLAELNIRGDEAYLIVWEEPGVEWSRASNRAGEQDELGPPAPAVATIGEMVLTGLREKDKPETIKAIVVLVPRVPDRFELLAN